MGTPLLKAAVDLKIINGFEDGTFRAGEPVTYEQAVKMLVCAVGYEVVAQSEHRKALISNPSATWSAGYIQAANKHKITMGVITAQITQPASRGVVAVLTSNALEVPELKVDENGNYVLPEEGEQEAESNMTTITGVVTGTFYTGVTDDETGLQENEIYIDATDNDDDGEYKLSDELADSIDLDYYIGKRVDVYYDNLSGEIASMNAKSTSSKVIEESSIESVNGYSIKYKTSNGRTSTEDLSTYNFIVNGKYVDDYDLSTLKNGTVEYFQTGSYRIAKVSSYDVLVVKNFVKADEKIFLKYATYNNNNYYLFPTRNSDKPVIYVGSAGAEYKKTEFENLSLSEYDVINYLESPDGTAGDPIRKMYVTKGAKSGKVTAKLQGEREVEIGNDTFYLTQQYYNFEDDSNDQKAPFELSDNCTYYLDYTGQIAAVKYSATDSTSWSYGYIYDVDTREEQIGIYTSSGVADIFTLKDSVKVNGSKGDADDVFDALEAAAAVIEGNNIGEVTNATYAQPIKYSASGKKIDAIDTILNADGEIISKYDDKETLNGSNDSFTYDGVSDGEKASTSTTQIKVDGKSYGINSATIIIYVPDDREDVDSYAVMNNKAAFSVTANRYTEVFAMDSSTNKAKMVIVYDSNPTLVFTGSSPYMVVSKVSNKSDTQEFTGYVNGGTESTISVSEDNFESSISNAVGSEIGVGDVIRYIKDNSGDIIAIQRIYQSGSDALIEGVEDEDEAIGSIKITTATDFVAKFGEVDDKDSTDNTVTIDCNGKTTTYKVGSTTFLKLTSNGKSVEKTVIDEVYTDREADIASTIITISNSVSNSSAAAKVIYIVK